MITEEELDARLKDCAKKYATIQAELYSSKLATQEAAIENIINHAIDDHMKRISWKTPRVINIYEFAFDGPVLPEINEKIKSFGLSLQPFGPSSFFLSGTLHY